MASALAKTAGLPDRTSEYFKAATDAFMKEMGGQINIPATPSIALHMSACKGVQDHVNETVRALPKRPN